MIGGTSKGGIRARSNLILDKVIEYHNDAAQRSDWFFAGQNYCPNDALKVVSYYANREKQLGEILFEVDLVTRRTNLLVSGQIGKGKKYNLELLPRMLLTNDSTEAILLNGNYLAKLHEELRRRGSKLNRDQVGWYFYQYSRRLDELNF